jgi:hypothetical protein
MLFSFISAFPLNCIFDRVKYFADLLDLLTVDLENYLQSPLFKRLASSKYTDLDPSSKTNISRFLKELYEMELKLDSLYVELTNNTFLIRSLLLFLGLGNVSIA